MTEAGDTERWAGLSTTVRFPIVLPDDKIKILSDFWYATETLNLLVPLEPYTVIVRVFGRARA